MSYSPLLYAAWAYFDMETQRCDYYHSISATQ